MIALTQSIFNSNSWALVAINQRFEFTEEWGPMLADILCSQWPKCESCEDRACKYCDECGNSGCYCTCQEEGA